jgi:hypothetical protein
MDMMKIFITISALLILIISALGSTFALIIKNKNYKNNLKNLLEFELFFPLLFKIKLVEKKICFEQGITIFDNQFEISLFVFKSLIENKNFNKKFDEIINNLGNNEKSSIFLKYETQITFKTNQKKSMEYTFELNQYDENKKIIIGNIKKKYLNIEDVKNLLTKSSKIIQKQNINIINYENFYDQLLTKINNIIP